MGCNTCHTRVLHDGTVVPGAPGNNPGDRQGALLLRRAGSDPSRVLDRARGFARELELSWLPDDPNRLARSLSLDELIAAGEAVETENFHTRYTRKMFQGGQQRALRCGESLSSA